MKLIDIFYQGEGIAEVQHLETAPSATFGELRSRLATQHGLKPDTLLFVEEDEQPVEDRAPIASRASALGLTVHAHRCRKVNAAVTFNNRTVEHLFSPANTVGHVKTWIATHKFDMTKDDAGEHLLQISGTKLRPPPGTQLGTLTDGKTCSVAFDLVADERVNGSPDRA